MGCLDMTVDAPAPLDPTQVGNDALYAQLALAPQVLAAEQQYRPAYNDLQQQLVADAVLGQRYFNAGPALASMDPGARANIEAEAARQGLTPEQWLTGHVGEQAGRGDAYAAGLQQQYGGRTGGILDLYAQAVPALTNLQTQANTAQRQADIADVANLGPTARAAYDAANPELAAARATLAGSIGGLTLDRGGGGISSVGAATSGATRPANVAQSMTLTPTGAVPTTTLSGYELVSLPTSSPGVNTLSVRATPDASEEQQRAVAYARMANTSLGGIGGLGAGNLQAAMDRYSALSDEQKAQLDLSPWLDQPAASAAPRREINVTPGAGASGYEAWGISSVQPSAIQRTLEQQARDELALGGDLTPAELRAAQQASRSALSARGLALGPNAVADEVLSTDFARRQRQNERRAFAAGVDAQGYGQRMGAAQLGFGYDQFNRTLAEQRLAADRSYALSATGMLSGLASDPYQLVLGRSGTPAAAGNLYNQGYGSTTAGPSLFDPYHSGITNIFAGNQANQLAANTATANNRAGLIGAGISAIGNIFGGWLGAG